MTTLPKKLKANKLIQNLRKSYMMFLRGRASILDYQKRAEKVHPVNTNIASLAGQEFFNEYKHLWSQEIRKTSDIMGFDVPFGQIARKTKAGRNVYLTYTPSAKRKIGDIESVSNEVAGIINKHFSVPEIKKMDYVAINTGTSRELRNYLGHIPAGCTTLYPLNIKGKKRQFSCVLLHKEATKIPSVITHELIHTIHFRDIRDKDFKEILTDLDALRRTGDIDSYVNKSGYYLYFYRKRYGEPNRKLLRRLVTEDLKLLRKNCRSWDDVRRVARKTNLWKLANGGNIKGSAENIDRYFVVEQGKRRIRVHTRGSAKTKAVPVAIKRWMKQKGVRVYEWKDGKKVRLK